MSSPAAAREPLDPLDVHCPVCTAAPRERCWSPRYLEQRQRRADGTRLYVAVKVPRAEPHHARVLCAQRGEVGDCAPGGAA